MTPQAAGSFWSALGPDEAADLHARGVKRSIAAGHTIWHLGQIADRVVIIVQSPARPVAVPRRSLRWPGLRPRRQSEATRRQNAELAAWPPDRYGTGRRLGDQWSHMWWRQ